MRKMISHPGSLFSFLRFSGSHGENVGRQTPWPTQLARFPCRFLSTSRRQEARHGATRSCLVLSAHQASQNILQVALIVPRTSHHSVVSNIGETIYSPYTAIGGTDSLIHLPDRGRQQSRETSSGGCHLSRLQGKSKNPKTGKRIRSPTLRRR